jgi:Fe-S-cluster-containing hydrogenase component 2
MGTCVRACPFDAMVMDEASGLPRVLEDRCTACGTCAEVCPKNIIEILPKDRYVHVLCRNRDPGKATRQTCKVGCIACRACEKVCPVEGKAVHVQGNLATVDMETCISCGKCAAACPTSCIGNYRALRRAAKKKTA